MAFSILLAGMLLSQVPNQPVEAFRSAFDPKTATWDVAWPGRVAKHDLVYLTPPGDPMQGVPLGNGDVGVLCWCEGSKMIFALNKCDLWDDAPFGRFHNWKADEEDVSTTLRHAGRLIIDFHVPLFHVFYLSDFTGRLRLADAAMTVSADSPFGRVLVRAFVDQDTGVLCCEVSTALKENLPVTIRLERFGSRTFSHWYGQVNRNAAIGLDGTEVQTDETGAYLTHRLTTGAFAVGCSLIGQGDARVVYEREQAHAAVITVSGGDAKSFGLLLTVTSPLPDDPVAAVKDRLDAARRTGMPAMTLSHAAAWRRFWEQSLMEFGDDYLDNLWHLTQYYANASQRGPYPGRFINGLWSWSRDVQNWNFFFHWNQQQVYWPLNAAGHHELVDAYLNYRFNALPLGRQDARKVFNTDGAMVSDVCERRGYNSATEFKNHTPVAQIAMDFWRQYTYTKDSDFLKDRALPYLLEAAKFFESLFELGEDGRYHAKCGTGYEGSIELRDAITELVYGRVLFATTIRALDECEIVEPRAEKWKEMLDKMAPLPTVHAGPELLADEDGKWRLKRALFKGTFIGSNKIFAAGFGIKEQRPLTSLVPNLDEPDNPPDLFELIQLMENNDSPYTKINEDMKGTDGIFPWVEFAPAFPSGLIGLGQRESELFKQAVNTTKVFGTAGMGWSPLPIVLARLGLSVELDRVLTLWPGRWQLYCNGFGHYGPRDFAKCVSALRFRTNPVMDTNAAPGTEPKRFPFPAWPFRHMGMESMSVLACAMNEALLQSHDGVVRVAPAAGTRDARFTLHATGGFVVSAEVEKGVVRWVSIVSRFGGPCRFENPWPEAFVKKNGEALKPIDAGIVEFHTQKGDRLLFVPDITLCDRWKTVSREDRPNQAAKTNSNGKAFLGLPRMF